MAEVAPAIGGAAPGVVPAAADNIPTFKLVLVGDGGTGIP